uniref:Uncharacterized protein n=1 Tax=Anguilla anguilla TaxID=7936 RepID=A0A0E9XVS8_ANGAN
MLYYVVMVFPPSDTSCKILVIHPSIIYTHLS